MMTSISQASLMKGFGPTLTQADVAMEMLAQRTGGNLQVSTGSSGNKINDTPISEFLSKNTITKDTVSFSPSATTSISRQQVALNIIEASQKTPDKDAASVKNQTSTSSALMQIAAQTVSTSAQTADTSSTSLGKSIIGSQDPASVVAAYMQETPAERFYGSSEDPSTIQSSFFTSPEQQASYIAAFNSGTLDIQDAGNFVNGDAENTVTFSSSGSSSQGSEISEASKVSYLNSSKYDNVITFFDPIAGSLVISWNNKK